MIDKAEFYRRVNGHHGELTIHDLRDIVKSLVTADAMPDVLDEWAGNFGRRLMQEARDENGDRIYHNVSDEAGNPVYKQEELFTADDYMDVIAKEEKEINRRIRKVNKIAERARNKGIDIPLQFTLDLA